MLVNQDCIFLIESIMSEKTAIAFKPGVGCDIGTSNIVVSRQTIDGTFISKTHRDMLYSLDVSDESADLLKRSNYLYVQTGNKYYVIGEDALRLVNAIGKGEVIRPMKNGILNPSLKESSELLFFIIKAVVGEPVVKNESLRFSV
jgi:actin-like ATPase involved in cell morphogenesis